MQLYIVIVVVSQVSQVSQSVSQSSQSVSEGSGLNPDFQLGQRIWASVEHYCGSGCVGSVCFWASWILRR